MTIDNNKATVLEFLGHMVRSELDELVAMLTPDFHMWVAGDLRSSGSFDGPDAVAHLRGTGGGSSDLFKSSVRLDIGEVTAEADRVCVEAATFGELSAGGTYENTFHFFFRVRDGKVAEMKEYMDTKHVAESIPVTVDPDGTRVPNLQIITASIGG
jgi:uncharacterized protein